jgi:hypothetical protein
MQRRLRPTQIPHCRPQDARVPGRQEEDLAHRHLLGPNLGNLFVDGRRTIVELSKLQSIAYRNVCRGVAQRAYQSHRT